MEDHMPKVLIVYDSRAGVVYGMAKAVAEGLRSEGVEAIMEDVSSAEPTDLEKYDGLIVGSQCYMANMTGRVKQFLDATWPLRGKLDGKVGAAFAAERHVAGGAEETLRSIQDALLIHGMVIQGDSEGGPFGPVALHGALEEGGEEDVVAEDGAAARRLGERVASLVKKLA
jgi:NAD(P)H dehydrogenase (quinone)